MMKRSDFKKRRKLINLKLKKLHFNLMYMSFEICKTLNQIHYNELKS